MLTVKLNEICAQHPSARFWQQLLANIGKTRADDTDVSVDYILTVFGVDDALWCLRALPAEYDNAVRLLMCELVKPALQYTIDPRFADAFWVAQAFARGEATEQQLKTAEADAWEAVEHATKNALGASLAVAWTTVQNARSAVKPAAKSAAEIVSVTEQKRIVRRWLQNLSQGDQK